MKKIISLLMSVAMVVTMFGAFGLSASAAVTEDPNGSISSLFGVYYGIIEIDTISDLDKVYQKWTTTNEYDNYQLLIMHGSKELTKSYNFVKENGSALSVNFKSDSTINENVTLKVKSISGCTNLVNKGTIVITQPAEEKGGFVSYIDDFSNTVTNNGTIIMLNTDKILCYSATLGQYPIINNGTIQTPTGKITFNNNGKTNANGDVYMNPASTGFVEKLPIDINSPTKTGDSNLSMSGVAIPAPTYTVTIPKTIDFGTCDKAMKNDTDENKIKTIDVNGLSITHSNLYANEKQVTVTLGSDFTIKDGDNALNFELYDGENKLVTNKVLITANPTQADDGVSDTKPLTAKLDKSQIKKSGTYRGIVTFTVAMSDNA